MKLKQFTICCFSTLLSLALANSMLLAQNEEKSNQELFQDATDATTNQDFEKAVKILRELIVKTPDNPAVQFYLGYNLHASGNIDEALGYHMKVAAADSNFKPTALYNVACVHSLKKDSDKAFEYLKKSIEAGFRTIDQLHSDSDMDNIRNDPRFAEMIVLIENDGKAPPKKLVVEDLFGEWKIRSGTRAGSSIESDRLPTIKITKKTFTIPSEAGEEFVMSYKVDMDAKPITIDFKIESGPVPEGNAKGIIKLEDGVLTLCYHPEGESRPEKFMSTEENGFFVFKMKKAAEKTEAKGDKGDIAEAVIGKWKCIKGTRAGEVIEPERMASVITFDPKMITIPIGEDEAFKMSYTIDAGKNPIAIDMKIVEGPAPDSEALGIIKMDGGKFFLCYDPTGQKRPDKFESTESDGRFLFEMESAKN